jgi:formamidopyrimidine-DNA glycosylase
MPPGELALIVIVVISALLGVTYVTQKRSTQPEMEQKRLGAANALLLQQQAQQICIECNKPVNATTGDVFDKGAWWCQTCYRQVVSISDEA